MKKNLGPLDRLLRLLAGNLLILLVLFGVFDGTAGIAAFAAALWALGTSLLS
ncbi:MAG: YgaP-like transmembrane domain, partial [Endomicrobiales bacterium]